jgi:hypothetical protein
MPRQSTPYPRSPRTPRAPRAQGPPLRRPRSPAPNIHNHHHHHHCRHYAHNCPWKKEEVEQLRRDFYWQQKELNKLNSVIRDLYKLVEKLQPPPPMADEELDDFQRTIDAWNHQPPEVEAVGGWDNFSTLWWPENKEENKENIPPVPIPYRRASVNPFLVKEELDKEIIVIDD